jgi:glycosyltransferase involved in cell wall biosynthesis
MNIVYIGRYNKNDILSGPEKVARRIFDNISKKRNSVFIEYFFDGNNYGIFKKLFGKEIVDSINESNIYRMGIIAIFFCLLKIRPKIIHIITFERFALVCFIYKIFLRVKIIYNVHGVLVHENKELGLQKRFYNFKDKIVEKIIIKYSDILLLLSAETKIILEKYCRIKENKIKYIKNGVDSEYHNAGINKIYSEKSILKIVFIADIRRKEKGYEFLKNSLEKIENNIELYIIDRKENILSFKNKLICVFCFDKMSSVELANLLINKDVFISASFYEPFSISSVECMSAGLIPVLTKETGASELIVEGVNGYLYNYNDSDKLIKILSEFSINTELRKKVSGEAMKIFNVLDWEKISNDYLSIYNSALK